MGYKMHHNRTNTNTNIKIISLYYNNYNYGGMLQAYSLYHFIECYAFHSQQLALKIGRRPSFLSRIKSLNIKKLYKKIYITLIQTVFSLKKQVLEMRSNKFYLFQEHAVDHSEPLAAQNVAHRVCENDIFIAGSDQIWNPAWTEDAYFLNFVPDHNGKIAYAASIGTNSVSQAYLEHVTPLLNRFDFISVREESAKEILQPYVDKPIKVVLDPTLLLTRDEWDKIAVQPAIPQPYIFVDLLGEKREHRRLIKRYAQTLGLKIAFIPHVHFRFNPADCFFADYNLYDVGPREFVGLIKNAEMVITDSFHGCVF